MKSLSVVRNPILRYALTLPLHSGVKIGRCYRFNALILSAKKDRRSSDGSSWKRKRPRKRYSPRSEELGDISVLYSKNVVVESTPDLVKACNEHIDYFVEDRSLSEAQELFDLMRLKEVEPDVFTYTTLMKGYSRVGNTKKVSELFAEMEDKGIRPNEVTFNTAITSYASKGDLEGAQSFFRKMKNTDGVEPDVYTFSSMLTVCVSARDLETAKNLLKEMRLLAVKANNVVLNSMLDVYAECCKKENGQQYLEECRELIEKMEEEGIRADKQTYSTLLKLCARGSLTANSIRILNEMRSNGMRPDVFSYSTVLDGISKDQELSHKEVLELSTKIVKKIKKEEIRPNATTFNSLISVALRVEDLYRAKRLFQEMRTLKVNTTVVTYGTMIKCYEKLGDPKKGYAYLKPCLELLEECKQAGMKMGAEGYTSLLSACAKASNLDQATRVWDKMVADDIKPNVTLYNAIINVCVSARNMDKALSLFSKMKTAGISPNFITYGTMIKCYERLGDPREGDAYLNPCLDLWHECEKAETNLTVEGYTSLLSACANAANLDQALRIWSRMTEKKKIRLDVSVYNAMIKACLSKDKDDLGFDFLDQMKTSEIKPNVVTYGTFLSDYVKKEHRVGAEKILAEMKLQGVQPDRAILRMMKVIGIE